MNIQEVFDTVADVNWKETDRFLIGEFKVNNIEYKIQIQRRPIEGVKNGAEVSFYVKTSDNEQAFSTMNLHKLVPTKVYGIVFNALLTKVDQFDTLYFNAEKRHSKTDKEWEIKLHIYSTLAMRLKNAGFKEYQTRSHSTSTEWVLSKVSLNENSKFIYVQQLAVERANEMFS